ncbi:hypothetical protein [Hyunsoonleella rubra]|uniref:Uncharacterized protein n=1 Tax=Hyunsoonleella rubra TaxID=1737062 RepID=A0ABW5T7Q7_9FLAO
MNKRKSIVENEYVPISAFVALDKLPAVDSINRFLRGKEKSEEVIAYLNWEKSSDELVSFCRAVCEIEIPKKFDFLIDLQDNLGGIDIDATITKAIWNGMLPLNFIDLGYKTFTIIKFKGGVPERLDSLEEMDEADFKPRFVLCSKSNKNEIITELERFI